MRVIPISEILKMEDGEGVMSVKGIITDVYERKDGEKNGRGWSLQNIMLKEGANSIRCVLGNRDELSKSWKCKTVLLSSSHSDKHGWTGVKVNDNTYNGKTTKELKVTHSAEIAIYQEDGAQEPPPQQQRAPQQQSRPAEPPPASEDPEAKEKAQRKAFSKAKVYGAKCLVLHKMARSMAALALADIGTTPKDSPDLFQSFTATFFIELQRHVDIDALPRVFPETKAKPAEPPPDKQEPPPQQAPTDEEEPESDW